MTDRRAGKAAHQLCAQRITGMQTASDMLGGQRYLAERLGIGTRGLRAKLSVDRGISYCDLTLAAKGLRERAARLVAHADKLEALAEDGVHA
jgi:hypothetical protein